MGAGKGGAFRADNQAVHGAGNSEMAEQAFRVVARDGRLDDGGDALGKHAGQQDGAFHLGARHGKSVGDGADVSRMDEQRGAPGFASAGLNFCSHLFQRAHDAAHGAGTQGGVPEHLGIKWAGSQHAGQQSHARAGIPAINGTGGRMGPHGHARDAEAHGAAAFPALQHLHPRSQLFHGAQGVQAVLTAQEVVYFRHSVRQAAQNGGAVGDALVSGYGQYPLQGRNGTGVKVHELFCPGRTTLYRASNQAN